MRRWHLVQRAPARRARRVASGALVACLALLAVRAVAQPSAAAAGGAVSIVETSVPGSFPWGTAPDASGMVWVAMPGCDPAPSCPSSTAPGKLARYNPASQGWRDVVSLPAGYGQPLFVAVGPNGILWFTMPVTNAIGAYDPVDGTVRQWPVPTAGAGPWDLAIDASGGVWFTEHYADRIGRLDPSTGTIVEHSTPSAGSNPYGITIDTAGNVWFTENPDAIAQIGKYVPGHGIVEYRIRNSATAGTGLTPHLIAVDGAGRPWWTEGWVHAIAQLDPALAQPGTASGVTEHPYTVSCSSCGSHGSGIGVDATGQVWFDDSLQNTITSYTPATGVFASTPTPSGGHTHDGLSIASGGRIWFTEEFANKLGLASTTPTTSTTSTVPSTTSTSVPSPTTSTTVPVGGVVASDSFVRPNQALWGTASDGQVWGGAANVNRVFSVAGNVGVVANTGGTSYSAVLGPSMPDGEAFATGSMSSFTYSNFGDVLRWTDDQNWYKAYLDGANLVVQRRVNGTTSMVASVPFAATAGVPYTIHFRVVGSSLSANAWPSSASEPAGWMVSANDSSLTAGLAGMRVLTQRGTLTVTDFQARTP